MIVKYQEFIYQVDFLKKMIFARISRRFPIKL